MRTVALVKRPEPRGCPSEDSRTTKLTTNGGNIRPFLFVDAELLPGPYAPVIRGLQAQGLTAEILKRLGSWGRAWDLLRLACSPEGPSLALVAERLKTINLLALIQEYERSYSEPDRYRLPAAEIAQRRRDAKALARLLSSAQSAR